LNSKGKLAIDGFLMLILKPINYGICLGKSVESKIVGGGLKVIFLLCWLMLILFVMGQIHHIPDIHLPISVPILLIFLLLYSMAFEQIARFI